VHGEDPLDPETIHNWTREERQEWIANRRRKFIENGPPQLRPLREEVQNLMDLATSLITAKVRLELSLKTAKDQGVPEETLKAIENAVEAAREADIACREKAEEASRRLSRETRECEIASYPPHLQAEVRRLFEEREAALQAVYAKLRAGSVGRVAGTQFGLLYQIDKAEERGDESMASSLVTRLEKVKTETSGLMEDQRRGIEEARAIRASYKERLAALREST
jgi:hypothetical protein